MIKVCMGLEEYQGKKPGSEVAVAGDNVKLKKGKLNNAPKGLFLFTLKSFSMQIWTKNTWSFMLYLLNV